MSSNDDLKRRIDAAIKNNAAEVGLPGAIQAVNRTLDDIMLDLDKVYKSEVEAGRGDTAL